MQQCVVSDILIFFFQIHYIQGTLYEVMHGIYEQKLRFFKSLFSQEIKKEINYNTRISFEFVMAEFFFYAHFLFVLKNVLKKNKT